MRIASVQIILRDHEKSEERFQQAQHILEQIERGGERPDLILFPELWDCGFFAFDAYEGACQQLEGRSFTFFNQWARRLKANILTGSFVEGDTKERYNTTLFLNREGRLCGAYRKIHLFGYGSEEARRLCAGNDAVVIEADFGTVGLSTCYDLRFPEQYRCLVEQGAEFFLLAAAWPMARLEHWRILQQARALENQCFLISCNCVGEQNGTTLAGHSMTVAPDGTILAEADEKTGILWSQIDPGQVKSWRGAFPALADRVTIMPGAKGEKR